MLHHTGVSLPWSEDAFSLSKFPATGQTDIQLQCDFVAHIATKHTEIPMEIAVQELYVVHHNILAERVLPMERKAENAVEAVGSGQGCRGAAL